MARMSLLISLTFSARISSFREVLANFLFFLDGIDVVIDLEVIKSCRVLLPSRDLIEAQTAKSPPTRGAAERETVLQPRPQTC